MMHKLSTDSKTDLLIHIGILFTAGLVLFFSFFFLYLPWSTNHGNMIKVPELKGLTVAEAEEMLDDKNLNFEISDSTFVAGLKPLTVFAHYPKPDAYVKKGRKIFLTVITDKVPKVGIPDIIGRSVNSARNLLSSIGLQVDQVEFIPAIEKNTVLKLKYKGQEVSPNKSIPKGSKLTLVAGDGFGNRSVTAPELIGMSQEEAEILISGSSLTLGNVLIDNSSGLQPGMVVRQSPEAGESLEIGDEINIWISGN